MRFLIIQTAFIGDVVLATAVAEKLHAAYPEATIDFMVRKGNEVLLQAHPFLGHVYVWNKRAGKLRHLFQIARQVRRARYTHVINLHRHAATGLVCLFSGAAQKRGFDKNPFSWCYTKTVKHYFSKPEEPHYLHEAGRNHQLIDDLTDPLPAMPRLYPSTEDYALVKPWKERPYICIAPSSVWFSKRFPVYKWVELLAALPDGYQIYFLSGREDAAMADEIISLAGASNCVNLGGKLTLMQSAALMQDAAMNYTNDSGPLHFASAVDAPATAVFCSTHECYGFGPLSTISRLIEYKGLYCKPCGIHGYDHCPQGHFRCAKDLDTNELLWWISKAI